MKRYLSIATLSLVFSAMIPVFTARANSITVDSNTRMRAVTDHSSQSLQNPAPKSLNTQANSLELRTNQQEDQDIPEYCAPFLSSHEDGALRDALLHKCKHGG